MTPEELLNGKPLPDCIEPGIFADWCEYRLKDVGRKRFTVRACAAFLRRCERLHAAGYDVNAAIDYAMDVGWLTVYEKDAYKRKSRPAAHGEGTQGVVMSDDEWRARRETNRAKLREVKG